MPANLFGMNKTQALVPQEHMTVAQSVDVTMSGLGYTKTQRRLLYEVIRNIQPLYKGVDVKKQKGEPLNYSSFVDKVFSIPIKDILSDGNHNYNEFKDSLLDMIHKLVLVKDDGKDFYVVNFVDMLHIPEGSGVVRIRMRPLDLQDDGEHRKRHKRLRHRHHQEVPESLHDEHV